MTKCKCGFYMGEIVYYKKSRADSEKEVWVLAVILRHARTGFFMIRDKETGIEKNVSEERLMKLSEMKTK